MRAAVKTVHNYYDRDGKRSESGIKRDLTLKTVCNEDQSYNTRYYKLRIDDKEIVYSYYEWEALVHMMEWIQK